MLLAARGLLAELIRHVALCVWVPGGLDEATHTHLSLRTKLIPAGRPETEKEFPTLRLDFNG